MHSVQDLWDIDLNLLVVLEVLLRERSVTRSARRLHRTPSAISHALGRLREVFHDELLVREGQGMRPTARGLALAETLPEALGRVAAAVADPGPFDFATSTRTFQLVLPEFGGALVPSLLARLGEQAPGVRVVFLGLSPEAAGQVKAGQVDGFIGPSGDRDGLRGEPLGAWPWRVFGRRGHPAFDDWTVEAWAAHPHLVVGRGGVGRGPVGQRAHALGIERTVGSVVPHFSMAPAVLMATDHLLTVPSMALHGAAGGLDSRATPFDIPPMGLSVFRGAATGEEPGVRWFLDQVVQVFAGLGAAPTPPHV